MRRAPLAARLRWALGLASFGLVGAALAQSESSETSAAAAAVALTPEEALSGPDGGRALPERWSLHFQTTVADQAHPDFPAAYSGPLSMSPHAESAIAFISTLGLDVRLWPQAELVFDPEMSGGYGLSHSSGVAAFPSGIVYRVGNPAPTLYLARLLFRQTIPLGPDTMPVVAGINQLAGRRSRDSFTLSAGRLAVTDVFDGDTYAHDPTSQFFDWALFASGAWDYPADTRGYTYGVLGDLTVSWWSVRAGIALEPEYANLETMDWNVLRSHGLMAEGEVRWTLHERPGAARVLVFLNVARMGSYAEVVADPAAYGDQVQATRADGRTKYGAAGSVDQQLTPTLGGFLRASWDDGANETWAFTEIDRSLAAGLVKDGSLWGWRDYQLGGAGVIDGLARDHRLYLQGGGLGFILGDGAMKYAPEIEGDLYFRVQVADFLQVSVIYQPVINPAYNQERGPIQIFTGRVKVVF